MTTNGAILWGRLSYQVFKPRQRKKHLLVDVMMNLTSGPCQIKDSVTPDHRTFLIWVGRTYLWIWKLLWCGANNLLHATSQPLCCRGPKSEKFPTILLLWWHQIEVFKIFWYQFSWAKLVDLAPRGAKTTTESWYQNIFKPRFSASRIA